jgi:hypothetical protein
MSALAQVLVAGITGLAAVGASFMTATATANNELSDLDKKIEVIQERENNHYLEVKQTLDRIEKKLDQI